MSSALNVATGFALALIAATACGKSGSEPAASGGQGGTPSAADECEFGDQPGKCGGESDVACALALGEPGDACDSDEDCTASDELCFIGASGEQADTCRAISGVCMPLPKPDDGLEFGESCDLDDATDPCAGACVPIGDGQTGECEQTCRVGAASGCGAADLDGADVACAFFAYDLSDAGIEQGAGDLGICARLCDCNADCPGMQRCLSAPTSSFLGICAGGIALEDSIEACADGVGGAGGSTP